MGMGIISFCLSLQDRGIKYLLFMELFDNYRRGGILARQNLPTNELTMLLYIIPHYQLYIMVMFV